MYMYIGMESIRTNVHYIIVSSYLTAKGVVTLGQVACYMYMYVCMYMYM